MDFIESDIKYTVNTSIFTIGNIYRIRYTENNYIDFLGVCTTIDKTYENDEGQPYVDFIVFKWISETVHGNIFRLCNNSLVNIFTIEIDEIILEEMKDLRTMETYIKFPLLKLYR